MGIILDLVIILIRLNAQCVYRCPSDHKSYTVKFPITDPEAGLRDHESCAHSSRVALSAT